MSSINSSNANAINTRGLFAALEAAGVAATEEGSFPQPAQPALYNNDKIAMKKLLAGSVLRTTTAGAQTFRLVAVKDPFTDPPAGGTRIHVSSDGYQVTSGEVYFLYENGVLSLRECKVAMRIFGVSLYTFE
jgi:hypothetical protein